MSIAHDPELDICQVGGRGARARGVPRARVARVPARARHTCLHHALAPHPRPVRGEARGRGYVDTCVCISGVQARVRGALGHGGRGRGTVGQAGAPRGPAGGAVQRSAAAAPLPGVRGGAQPGMVRRIVNVNVLELKTKV